MAALWIGADLAEAVALPGPEAMRRAVVEQLAFMDGATDTYHCRDTKIIPFSMHNVDEVLGDLDLNIGATVRASHWLGAVDPAAYRRMAPLLLRRLPPSGPRPGPGFTGLTPVGTSPEAKKCPATCGDGACPGACQAPLARPGEARQGRQGPRGAHDPSSAVGRVPPTPVGPAQLPAECGSAAADGRCSCASARARPLGAAHNWSCPESQAAVACWRLGGLPGSRGLTLARRPRGLGLTFGGGEGAPGPHRFVTPIAARRRHVSSYDASVMMGPFRHDGALVHVRCPAPPAPRTWPPPGPGAGGPGRGRTHRRSCRRPRCPKGGPRTRRWRWRP